MELFTAAAIVLGLGTCGSQVDYCPDPVGKVALEVELVSHQNHSIFASAVHYSEIGNGEPHGGDRGTELYTINYKFTIRSK